MTESMTDEKALALRKPFPEESVGKLPKGGQMLDYVGHAAVTDRLLTVDPHWNWEPMAVDQFGSPQVDREGNLWIKLTVCGVTRIGVGDGKSMKERIGDALRNAAMRFGVALDLWAKENLVEFAQAANTARRQAERPQHAPPAERPATSERPPAAAASAESGELITAKTRRQMFALFTQKGVPEGQQLAGINHICGTSYESRGALLESDARRVIETLQKRPDAAPPTTDAAPAQGGGEAPDPEAASVTLPPARAMAKPQARMLAARFTELGVTDDEQPTVCAHIVGRPIETLDQLTRQDGDLLLRELADTPNRAALNDLLGARP